MEKSLTMVVGGMNPAFQAKIRRNGEIIGTAPRTSRVLNASYQILKKLNNGGAYLNLDKDYHRLTRRKSFKGMENAKYEGRYFIERGRSAARGEVEAIMTTKLESLIQKQVNRTTVNTQVRAS